MNKFEKTMQDLFKKLDNIDEVLKQKPPAVKKKGETEDFKLLREHYDNKFNDLRTEFKEVKNTSREPRKKMEDGNFSLLDFLLKP